MRKAILISLLLLVVVALLWFFTFSNPAQSAAEEIGISQVLVDTESGRVQQIVAYTDSQVVWVFYADKQRWLRSRLESNTSVTTLLLQAGIPLTSVDVRVAAAPIWTGLLEIVTILLPVLVMIVFFIYYIGRMLNRLKATTSQEATNALQALQTALEQTTAAKNETISAQQALLGQLQVELERLRREPGGP